MSVSLAARWRALRRSFGSLLPPLPAGAAGPSFFALWAGPSTTMPRPSALQRAALHPPDHMAAVGHARDAAATAERAQALKLVISLCCVAPDPVVT